MQVFAKNGNSHSHSSTFLNEIKCWNKNMNDFMSGYNGSSNCIFKQLD